MPYGVRNVKSFVETASTQVTSNPGKVRDFGLLSDGSNVGYARLIDGTPVTLDYDSGGTNTPTIGETITGAGTRTGTLAAYTTDSGTWGAGTAAGTMTLILVSGAALFTDNEALTGSTSGADMATADGTGTAGAGGAEIHPLKVSATGSDTAHVSFPEGRSFGALYLYASNCTASGGYTESA